MSLNPPQDYRKTLFTHRRDTSANKPLASDVLGGTLYFSSDTGTLERSNSSTWESYGTGIAGSELTAGSIAFGNGSGLAQDNANLFWDDTNNRVGIGTNTPSNILDVVSAFAGPLVIRVKNISTAGGNTHASFIAENSSSLGQLFKAGTGYVGYKNIQANDLGYYNTGGNLSTLNDAGNINFASHGALTPQVTISGNPNSASLLVNPYIYNNKAIYVNGSIIHDGGQGIYNDVALTFISTTTSGITRFSGIHNEPSFSLGGNCINIYSLNLPAPTVTLNGNLVTTAATLHIGGAPTNGTNKYALLIDGGLVTFGGGLGIGTGAFDPGAGNFRVTGTSTLNGNVSVGQGFVGGVTLSVNNALAGVGNSAAIIVGTDAINNMAMIGYSSTYTPSGFAFANGGAIANAGNGGLSFAQTGAGDIRFYTSGAIVLRMKIATSGTITTSSGSSLLVNGAIIGALGVTQIGTGDRQGLVVLSPSNDAYAQLYYDGTSFKFESTYISSEGYKPFTFWTAGVQRVLIHNNIGLFTNTIGASMVGGITYKNGTAPTGNVTDCHQYYSNDVVAGNAAPHYRTETGDIIKLFKSAAYTPTNVTTDRSYDANATTLDEIADVLGTLIADLQATGLIG